MSEKAYSESGLLHELDALKGSQVYLWLQSQLQTNSTLLTVSRDDVQFRWIQGHSQQLTDIIKAIDEAAEKAWDERETAKKHAELKALRNKQF